MLIESLIRLGRPFLDSEGLSARDMIAQITDVDSSGAVGFYKNVLLVEVDSVKGLPGVRVAAHPLRSWTVSLPGEADNKSDGKRKRPQTMEVAERDRPLALPFVLATGGNPTVRQGYYSVPSYVIYEGSKSTTPGSLRTMPGNPDEVLRFLDSRAPYTVGWTPEGGVLEEVARAVANGLPRPSSGPQKTMALIGIVDYRTGVFSHRQSGEAVPNNWVDIGESLLYPSRRIHVNLSKVVENLWTAKMQEAAEKGKLDDGECSFCGATGLVVSSYAKGWPLFTTTYEFPLPSELKEEELVKSIALCQECYSALVLGANLFVKTAKTLDRMVTRELFSPTQSGMGKLSSRERRLEDIYGSCFILPVLDEFLLNEDAREDFVAGYLSRLGPRAKSKGIDVQLDSILGFEDRIGEELSGDNCRLTVAYYSGDWSRGAVDLQAIIQDVVPSVARALVTICRSTGETAMEAVQAIAASWGSSSSDARNAFYYNCCSSLPYLLVRAYGGPYLWQSLDSVLHRRSLDHQAFIRNVARRMMSLAKDLSDSERARELESEVVFFVSFAAFLEAYASKVLGEGGGSPMLDWRSWTQLVESRPASEWESDSIEEVGFVAGMLTRAFSRRYFMATGGRDSGKDFIKHRVMTFGADVRPRDIIRRGLARFSEYARRLDMLLPAGLREWAAATTIKCLAMEEEIRKDSDIFVAAFWSGFELCPANLFGKHANETEGAANGEPS